MAVVVKFSVAVLPISVQPESSLLLSVVLVTFVPHMPEIDKRSAITLLCDKSFKFRQFFCSFISLSLSIYIQRSQFGSFLANHHSQFNNKRYMTVHIKRI